MWEDPIVNEVRKIREQLERQFDFDVNAIFADLRKRQQSSGRRLVKNPKNEEPNAKSDSAAGPNADRP